MNLNDFYTIHLKSIHLVWLCTMKFTKSNLFNVAKFVEYDSFIVYIWMHDLFFYKDL